MADITTLDDITTCYDRVIGRIARLLLPEGPLHESPEAALAIDALDLGLRSWKYEFDQTTAEDFREQDRRKFEHLMGQVAQVFETLEPLLGMVEDCASRAPRTMLSLLPLLEAETEKLDEAERDFEDAIDITLPLESAIWSQESDDADSDNESDFDLSWRPDDFDSPEAMNRLLLIDRSDPVSEMLRAATLGHLNTVESLLNRPQWAELLSAVDSNGNTALQIAKLRRHEDIVQKILWKQDGSPKIKTAAPHVASRPDSPTYASPKVKAAAPHAASRPDSPTLNHVSLPSVDLAALRRVIENAEDVASILQHLRDETPGITERNLTDMTSATGELYRLSAILRQLRTAFEAPQYADRLYRILPDATLVADSARLTLNVALGMVGRASPATHWMIWDDLNHRLQDVERVPLSMRLKWYHSLSEGLLDQLEGYPFDATLARIKASVQALHQQQQPGSTLERPVRSSHRAGQSSSKPRMPNITTRLSSRPDQNQVRAEPGHSLAPRTTRAIQHIPTAATPRITMLSSPRPHSRRPLLEHGDTPPSNAPPQGLEGLYPQKATTVTWKSTHDHGRSGNIQSERNPNSSYDATPHWASKIFVDVSWRSQYHLGQQPKAVTRCKGDVQPDAKLMLQGEGFVPLTSVHFSDNDSILTFYWRFQNSRARVLFTSVDRWGQAVEYCNTLTHLRVFREGSILKLSSVDNSDERLFWTWAELKFTYHERMVLFYSIFIALKWQDSADLPAALIEDPRDMGEEVLFSGTIRDCEMLHVLRLLQDPGSGVVRLEARPYRGDRVGVPIWTAFLTNYKDYQDRDIFNLMGTGIVGIIWPKPKPYIFVPEHRLSLMSDGNIVLQFVKRDDAARLIEIWIGLCTSGRRS